MDKRTTDRISGVLLIVGSLVIFACIPTVYSEGCGTAETIIAAASILGGAVVFGVGCMQLKAPQPPPPPTEANLEEK